MSDEVEFDIRIEAVSEGMSVAQAIKENAPIRITGPAADLLDVLDAGLAERGGQLV